MIVGLLAARAPHYLPSLCTWPLTLEHSRLSWMRSPPQSGRDFRSNSFWLLSAFRRLIRFVWLITISPSSWTSLTSLTSLWSDTLSVRPTLPSLTLTLEDSLLWHLPHWYHSHHCTVAVGHSGWSMSNRYVVQLSPQIISLQTPFPHASKSS
jgi:hypothetical protein